MVTIEERAHKAEKKWLLSDEVTNCGYGQGYIQGAKEQHDIDLTNAKDAFADFVDYLLESGRINLEEEEDTEWMEMFQQRCR